MPTQETYNAAMSSSLLSDAMKQVYHALCTQALTKGEVEATCASWGVPKNPADPWDKALQAISKMGLAKRGDKRHCNVKQKEDSVWVLTNALPMKPKATKPSAKQYVKAIAQFEVLIAHHQHLGDGFITPELHKLYEWVRDKMPEQKA